MSADHFYLPRDDQRKLLVTLRGIPQLAEELAITETRQAVLRKAGLGSPRRPKKRASQLPFHVGAFDAMLALHAEMVSWIKLVCEQRKDAEPDIDNLTSAGAWLRQNIISLAMTEGAETAATRIGDCVKDCERQIDLPPDDEIVIDPSRLRAADRKVLTSYQIERIAGKLGAVGNGLNHNRVDYLVRRGKLKPCAEDGETRFYRLGEALAAHLGNPRRKART